MLEVVQHSFSFSSPKRERELSDEGQQEEAKRPKSPERKDEQLAEQHGSGGEGGEEEERERRERLPGGGFGMITDALPRITQGFHTAIDILIQSPNSPPVCKYTRRGQST